ncbi:CLUMA_CG021351, isoform A [Clunio marinus]|uniref:CLUMA_CG021351, isoform A n=1 Tax=Clunio marinus TaxID=568069 RepID=A0A1J1J7Z6_9DIPT|nr:CLUMA_CG021351, isoform A [Clunio marinus]
MFRQYNEDNGGFENKNSEVFANSSKQDVPSSTLQEITILRSSFDQTKLHNEMAYRKPPKKSILKAQCGKCSSKSVKSRVFGMIPMVSSLTSYKKDYLIGDVIAGCTVAVMHIPQGMAFALLAGLPAVVGIYMAFFPVLMYGTFGTSMHNSMGTFPVISIMVGKCVNKYTTISEEVAANATLISMNATAAEIIASPSSYTPTQVATFLCLAVGIFHLIMCGFRIGVVSLLLSESLVSGFTTGVAVQVITSQLKDLFGIPIPMINGHFQFFKQWAAAFEVISMYNGYAVIMSIIGVLVIIINSDYIKPYIAKFSKVPIPIELMLVVSATLLSNYLGMEKNWKVHLLGGIPVGLPEAAFPKLYLWKELLVDSFAIALVSYSTAVSMALIFAQRNNYEIDFNQELLAMGISNIFGSFFQCMPLGVALSRSLLQESVGGTTQLASYVSCALILVVLLWIGPYFAALPRCILAAVVCATLKGMIMQVKDFPKFNKKSKTDGFVWMSVFFVTVLVSIDVGLLYGVVLSISIIFYNSLKADICILGQIPNTDLFLDVERFEKAIELSSVKICKYTGSINFATKASFKSRLCKKLGVDLIKCLKIAEKNLNQELTEQNNSSAISNGNGKFHEKEPHKYFSFKNILLDFSGLTFIDASSINMLSTLIDNFETLHVKVLLAGCSSKIYETLDKNEFRHMTLLYPTIQDALKYLT